MRPLDPSTEAEQVQIGRREEESQSPFSQPQGQHHQHLENQRGFDININPSIQDYQYQHQYPYQYQYQSPSPHNTSHPQFQDQRSFDYRNARSQYYHSNPISPSGFVSYVSSRSSLEQPSVDHPSISFSNPTSIPTSRPTSTETSSSNTSATSTSSCPMPASNSSNHSNGGTGFPCPNCGKSFAREDLRRRHVAREARAAQQPHYERQKSCHECSRSKARCDLEVPSCGRCKQKGKTCTYAPRSGNPNVRKINEGSGVASGSTPSSGRSSGSFENPTPAPSNQAWGQPYPSQEHSLRSEDEFEQYKDQRHYSTGSASTIDSGGSHSMNPSDQRNQFHHQPQHQQQHHHRMPETSYYPNPAEGYHSSYPVLQRSSSPYQHAHALPPPPSFRHPSGLPSSLEQYSSQLPPNVRMGNPSHPPPPPPPQEPPHRPDVSMTIAPHLWPEGEAPSPSSLNPNSFLGSSPNQQASNASRQMPPPLLTGARMPGPPSGIMKPSLFTASLDLSGWLDEPVVPSPLYRMGPSFNSLGSALGSAFPQLSARPVEGRSEPPRATEEGSAPATATTNATSLDAATSQRQGLQIIGPDGKPIESAPNMISARHWWSQSNQSAPEGAEALAQISAAHLKTYPALMVLPDPTSPVPPFLNRSWIASLRALMPRSLAVARVVLAGYNVRLPPSEGMVWENLAREAKALIAGLDRTLEAADTEVWAATASLWLYLVLMMMTDDPASTPYVDSTLVDNALHALSQLAKTLAERVSNQEESYRPDSNSSAGQRNETFFSWGFLETMRRTLYAAYVLLVLQRYRENALNVQSRLAGFELILECQLPSSANQFEAGTEQEWREARRREIDNLKKLKETQIDGSGNENGAETDNKEGIKIKDEDAKTKGKDESYSSTSSQDTTFTYPTMKDLIQARHRLKSSSKTIDAYFDQTDSFTNICLTIAFALDSELASADPDSLPSTRSS